MAALSTDIVTISDLKKYLRVPGDDDDDLLESTLGAAVMAFQKDTGLQMIDERVASTLRISNLGSGDCIVLPGERAVHSVVIMSSDGSVLDQLYTPGDPASERQISQGWERAESDSVITTAFADDHDDVTVQWISGILASTVTLDIKQAIKIKVMSFYDSTPLQLAYQSVVAGYRRYETGPAVLNQLV